MPEYRVLVNFTRITVSSLKADPMFGLSNKKAKLEKKYKKLLEESYQLSKSNRMKGDQKLAEAEEVRKQLDELEQAE